MGKTITYTYDSQNNRTSETDSLGNKTSFSYNAQHKVLSITDPKGNVTTNTYDLKGNLLSTKDSLGEETKYKYTIGGLVESMTDALGNVTSFSYDPNGNPTQETNALGNVTNSTYDLTGNRLTQTVIRGMETLTTGYIYDKSGRATKTTYPDRSSTETSYNSIGKVAITKDSGGRQTSYNYDEMGQLSSTRFPDGTTESFTYDGEGRKITSTDRLGNITNYNYDKLGRLVQTTYADGSSITTSYDPLGRVNETKDANGFATNYEYDEIGRRTKTIDALGKTITFSYDANGNQVSRTDGLGYETIYRYDDNNRQIRITFADGTARTFTYDVQGKKLSETDPAGKRTSFEYDKLGRLVKVIDAIGKETSYRYNEVGQQISQTDANSHTTTYEYDKLGRRTKRKLSLGQEEIYSYNSNGTLASLTDFNGKTTTYNYDEMSRLLTKTPDISFGKSAIVYNYDAAGKRLTMTDESGVTNYSYDSRGRLLTKQTPQGTLSYAYDNAGNLLSTRSSNANGISEDFSYDKLNRFESVRDNNLGAANETKYNYDSVGNLSTVELPNGVRSSYTYDKLNRLTNLNTNKGTIASYGYKLGSAGNRLSVAELGRTVEYKYDDIYRLTRETIGTADISYNYDSVGNRLSRTSTVPGVSSTTETYDNNDRINSDSYDENGSTTTSNGKIYSYDFEQRLISVTGGGTDISIIYDGDGNRVSKSVTTGGVTTTTKYLVDENNPTGYAQVVEEIQNKKVVRQYTYGNDLISENQLIAGSWKVNFYGYDGHGSVRFLTDEKGIKTDSYDYDAFGILINKTGTTPNVYLYAGEQWDQDLGLYYNRARYLNTNTGRFFTKDSFEGNSEDPLSLHKYLYANNDPVNNLDPAGKYIESMLIGTLVHDEIGRDFIRNNKMNTLRNSNRGITSILTTKGITLPRRKRTIFYGLVRPDLIDFGINIITQNTIDLGFIYEIKPANQESTAKLESLFYIGILNAYDPGWRLGTYTDYTPKTGFTILGGLYVIDTYQPTDGVITYRARFNNSRTNPAQVISIAATLALTTALGIAMLQSTQSRGLL